MLRADHAPGSDHALRQPAPGMRAVRLGREQTTVGGAKDCDHPIAHRTFAAGARAQVVQRAERHQRHAASLAQAAAARQAVPMLEFVKALAREAATLARESRRSFHAELKPDASWVTNVDREVESLLKAAIQREFPGHTLFGEEYGMVGDRDAEHLWLLDPIDGTTNFVKNIPQWCISIGYLHRGEPTLGVIAVPPTNELFWATNGGGAFCNDEPIHAREVAALQQEDTVGVSSDGLKSLPLARITGRLRNLGAAAIDAAYTARGSLSAAVYLNEKAHDLAAGMCLAHEAGCETRWLSGAEVRILDLLDHHRREPYLLGPPRVVAQLRQALSVYTTEGNR